MNTRIYNPSRYRCHGTQTVFNTAHAKGCKKSRPLRWIPLTMRVMSVECARALPADDQSQLVRCVPTDVEKGIHYP